MSKSRSFLSILIPGATVFISSFCIMVLELVAARLIAKHVGSSLYTWTAVIGVVLAGITIGNYLGGRIADRFPARKALATLFAISSGACVITVILNNLVGEWVWLWHFSWPVRTFTHVSLVFLLPSVLLGTISPVVAKMALDKGLATGRTVGDIYAAGAAGSIAGTFAAGYYLIAAMGTIAIVWTIGGTLLVMAILYWARFWPLYLWAVIFGCTLLMGPAAADRAKNTGAALALRSHLDKSIIYEEESQYCYIAVKRLSTSPERREFVQDKLRHSEINMEDIDDLQYFYTKIYAGLTHGLSKGKDKLSVMVIGGGGYVYPRYVEKHWLGSRIDVVEIDPGVTQAAHEAFGLELDTTINTITMDGRNYVDELLAREDAGGEETKYDFIYEDAIDDYSVPFQLVTKEFNDKIARILADDGVYLVNLIDMYDSGLFLGAVVNTLKETFPHVHVITSDVSLPTLRDTFVVAAAKHRLDPEAVFYEHGRHLKLWHLNESDIAELKEKSGGVILTDDYAPVENLLAPVVRQSAQEILARKYLQQAGKLREQAKWGQSITKYRMAMELNPSMSIKAYNEIGLIEAAQGNLQEAAKALRSAIDYHRKTGAKEKIIATIHYNLGTALQRMNKREQAMEQFTKAAEEFRAELAENPDSAHLWTRLGNTLATMGNLKEAADAFRRALALNPANLLYYDNLVKALQFQGRLAEAIEVLENGVELMSRHGQMEAAAKLKQYLDVLEQQKKKSSREK
jgi:spermidine synthase/Flp pilus assembly protein TadD